MNNLSEEMVVSKKAAHAQRLILDFWKRTGEFGYEAESGETTSFDCPSSVLLAHGDYYGRPVLAIADLIDYRIMTFVDEMYFLRSDQYEDLQHMIDDGLSCLDHDNLIYISDDEWHLIDETESKLNDLAYNKNDLAAWHNLLTTTFPVVNLHTRG